jgi:EmrB/QacA subfamily drug resistance transporter
MNNVPTKKTGITGILIASILAAFLPPYMASSLNVALPVIGREFTMPAVGLSWLITSYLLAIGIGIVPFGKAGDMYGRRGIFLWGAIAYTGTTVLAGCMHSPSGLLIMRVLQGIGAAMIFGTGTALLVSVVPAEKRGSMLGLNVASTYIGLSIGPTLGGFLTQHLGWRSIFFTTAPFGLLISAVLLFAVKEDRPKHSGDRFDWQGAFYYGMALAALMIGLPQILSLKGIALTLVGLLIASMFVIVELRAKEPIVHIELFKRSTVFAFSSIAALLNYSATHGSGFLLSLYLQYIKGMPPHSAGLVMVFWPLLMALFSPLAGRLSDRVEPRIVASGGMALTSLALLYFSTTVTATPLYRIILGLVLMGIGIAFFSSPNTSAIMGSVEKRYYGMANSLVGAMRLVGQMLSMGIVTIVMNAFVGNKILTTALHPAFLACFKASFAAFGALCMLGVFASLARGRVRQKPEGNTAGPSDMTAIG